MYPLVFGHRIAFVVPTAFIVDTYNEKVIEHETMAEPQKTLLAEFHDEFKEKLHQMQTPPAPLIRTAQK